LRKSSQKRRSLLRRDDDGDEDQSLLFGVQRGRGFSSLVHCITLSALPWAIVGYSKLSFNEQHARVEELNEIVWIQMGKKRCGARDFLRGLCSGLSAVEWG
jgi:hypothetical protein